MIQSHLYPNLNVKIDESKIEIGVLILVTGSNTRNILIHNCKARSQIPN